MNPTSFEFALFFLLVLPLNWLLRPYDFAYRIFLLAASYVFYASFNLKFVLILFIFSFLTWFFAIIFRETADRRFRKFCLILYLCISLGILVFFKYYEMLYLSLDYVLGVFKAANPVPFMDVFLPIGISFFTFQGLSYAIDVYRDEKNVVKNPVDVFLFISFFPTILSGPILRAKQFIPQLHRKKFSAVDVNSGFYLLVSGLFKKLVISSYLSEHIVRQVFAAPEGFSSLAVLVGVVSYSIQIYCDFSGYTDMARGMGRLLGFDLPDNFNSPYASQNLRDFWHRWHITFSTWLRDYLYIPLGGNRKGRFRKYANLVVTMALGGLWHGAAYNFLVWGFIHGFGLVAVHLYIDRKTRTRGDSPDQGFFPAVSRFLGRVATFGYVTLAWVFFGAEDAAKAMDILARMADLDPEGATAGLIPVGLAALVLASQISRFDARRLYDHLVRPLPAPVQGAVLGLLAVVILKLGPDGVLPFIYFSF
ncbi:MBOAT family O-acyltransferase [Desulfolutivibrio sulfoxidireducens]|uniref:MBOAT family O-acyltransferase n=1 Tax=Desulfolutivibrio sulfoxidireducens TaxID=2773299 RepID=UPI00159DBB7E|nr:MBOAT family O-acyltransferase [Desulfolutivibrio sulfoxidireducens]QLA20800.1 MBOAT family protein [Desulfolutivibrio sulfoxidireducens]